VLSLGGVVSKFVVALVTAVVPVSYALPGPARQVWTLLVAAALIASFILGRVRLPNNAIVWVGASYLTVMSGLSASWTAVDVGAHWLFAAYLILFWGLAPFAATYFSAVPGGMAMAARVFVLVQTVSSLVAVYQVVTGASVLGFGPHYGRALGLAGHMNILGLMAAVAIVLLLAIPAQRRAPLILLAIGANLAGLFVSGSLSALIAFLAGGAVVLRVNRVSLRRIVAAAVLFVIVAWGITALSAETTQFRTPLERVAQTTGQTELFGTLDERVETVAYAWQHIQDDPVWGAGLDDQSGATYDGETLTQSIPFRTWFQGGIALFLAWILVFGSGVQLVARAVRSSAGGAAAGILAVLMVFAITAATLQQPYYWLLFVAAWSTLDQRARQGVAGDDLEDRRLRPSTQELSVIGA